MIKNIYQYREELKKQGVYLSVTGPFSHIIMEGIADMLKKKMKLENVKTSTMMNVFAIVVEQVQNIIQYSAETIPEEVFVGKSAEARLGTLVIGHERDYYYVLSGNLIKNANVGQFKERLTMLSSMTKNELKQHYKEKLKKSIEPGIGGSEMGLIDIARKVSKPFEFNFQPIDDIYSFFSLKTIV